MQLIEALLGPFGGLFAIGFGLGAGAAWAFAEKTIVKWAKKRIDEMSLDLKKKDADCDDKIRSVKNLYEILNDDYRSRIHTLEDRIKSLEERGAKCQ